MNGINHLVIQQTPILLQEIKVTPIRIHSADRNPCWNPSITRIAGSYICVTRSSNFYATNDQTWVYTDPGDHQTINRLHYLNDDLSVRSSQIVISDRDDRGSFADEYGIEDIRLFTVGKKLYGIGASVCKGKKGSRFRIQQTLFELDGQKLINRLTFASPVGLEIEKNWSPLVINDTIYIIYSHEPLVVYELTREGELKLISQQGPQVEAPLLRGGTPLVPWQGGYLCVVHMAPFTSDKCYYTHRLVRYDANLRRVETSSPFFIQRRGIEFAAGIDIVNDEYLLLSYGISDQAAYLVKIPLSKLTAWLLV